MKIILLSLLVQLSSCTLFDVSNKLNQFLMEKLAEDAKQTSNAVASPYSLLSALGLLYEGMGESSRNRVGLDFPRNDDVLHKMYKTEAGFKSSSKVSENLVIIDDLKEVKYSYAVALNDSYDSIAFRANFSTQPEKARIFVNRRVQLKTRNKIVDFLPQGSIDYDTGMVLINALYFNAKWMHEFSPNTFTSKFKLQSKKNLEVDAEFMSADLTAGYVKTPSGVEILSLPFEDQNYAMVFVVPNIDLKSFVDTELSYPNLMRAITDPDKLGNQSITLTMPKFSVKSRQELKDYLSKKPEMEEFFKSDADYSKMAEKGLNVNELYQTAVIDVTTGGVEAAAASGLTITLYTAFVADYIVNIDKPFLFFIVEKPTHMILFSGLVNDPRL